MIGKELNVQNFEDLKCFQKLYNFLEPKINQILFPLYRIFVYFFSSIRKPDARIQVD